MDALLDLPVHQPFQCRDIDVLAVGRERGDQDRVGAAQRHGVLCRQGLVLDTYRILIVYVNSAIGFPRLFAKDRAPCMRLDHPSIHRCGTPVAITYDGEQIAAIAGETVAAALAAHGIVHFRHTRDGGRRGLYCGMGACFDCLVTVDGQASQRACLTKVADGQHIRSQMPTGT